MKIIGVTGGVGAGKSTILDYLESQYHAYILKSDDAARAIEAPGGAIHDELEAILEEYPTDTPVCNPDGSFNNREIARRMFGNEELLLRVNSLVHPAVRTYIEQDIEDQRSRGREYYVLEAALLIECGYNEIVDSMWYIYTDENVRRQRLKDSRGYTDEKIDQIMASQLSDAQFREGSDVVIDNSGTPEETYPQIDAAMADLGD